jgi:simple sugar transport system substrate-binding protein
MSIHGEECTVGPAYTARPASPAWPAWTEQVTGMVAPFDEEPRMSRSRRSLQAVVALSAAAVALAACSSQGGAKSSNEATGKSYTIAMVTHEAPGDTFWDKIRNGAEQAAKDHNVTLKYSNDPDAGNQATLIQNAVSSKVDAIATTLPTPDAIGPAAQQAVQAGIPVVAFNAGKDQYKQYGISMYFGSDEDLAGQTVGTKISQENPGKTICVIQEQGQVQLEARCAGVKKTDPNSEVLYVNGRDLPAVQQTIGAKLQQDPSIANVVTLGGDIALAAQKSLADAGSKAKVATFDLNADVAQQIQDGGISFSVDQQPYVQGYMAVTALWLNLTNGNDIGGGGPVLTGPSIVDKSNIAKIIPYTKNNTR